MTTTQFNINNRYIKDVFIEIYKLVPVCECILIKQLDNFSYDLTFQAPEIINHPKNWNKFAYVLNKNINFQKINEEWQQKIMNIIIE